MPNPWQARRWREQGSEGTYAEMDEAVRPDAEVPSGPHLGPGWGARAGSHLQTVPELAELDPETPHDYPAGGPVAEVLGWVGPSPDRAAYALAVERMRAEPRRTVLGPLERMVR